MEKIVSIESPPKIQTGFVTCLLEYSIFKIGNDNPTIQANETSKAAFLAFSPLLLNG